MRKGRFLATGAALVSLFGAGLVAKGTPAQAYPSDCTNAAYICLYDYNPPGSSLLTSTYWGVYPKSQCWAWTPTEQKTSYISNPTTHRFVVYTDAYCLDNPGTIYAQSSGGMNSTYSNRIKSWFRAN